MYLLVLVVVEFFFFFIKKSNKMQIAFIITNVLAALKDLSVRLISVLL